MSLLWTTAVRIQMVPVEEVGNWDSGDHDGPVRDTMARLEENWHQRTTDPTYDDPWTSAEEIRHGGPRNYIEHLKREIAEHGIDEPLEAHQYHPDQTPALVDGHHRYIAASELGLTHVPVGFVR